MNKSDLEGKLGQEEIEKIAAEKEVEEIYDIVTMSAKAGSGLNELEEAIQRLVFGGKIGWQESAMVSNARQQEILRKALELLEQTRVTLLNGMSEDFVVIDLRSAWEKLGEITGETIGEDIIDEIFSRFCLGK